MVIEMDNCTASCVEVLTDRFLPTLLIEIDYVKVCGPWLKVVVLCECCGQWESRRASVYGR